MESLDRTLRRASKDRLVALVEDLCGVVPASRLLDVLGRHVDLDALTAPPETASDEPRSVLRDVGKFHAASLAGDYYDPFPVNSRNFMVRSEGAVDWEQECERLLQRCRTASRHGHHAQARECFDLLFDLLGRMDHGDEIVFFADEGGSWQVADVEPIWPDYFRSLAAVTAPEEYVKGVETLREQRLGSRPERLLAAARKAADPGQRRLLRARMATARRGDHRG